MSTDGRLPDHRDDASYRAKAFDPANTKGFAWNPVADLEATIRAKRVRPLGSVDELMSPDVFPSQDEVDEFAWTYREERQAMGASE